MSPRDSPGPPIAIIPFLRGIGFGEIMSVDFELMVIFGVTCILEVLLYICPYLFMCGEIRDPNILQLFKIEFLSASFSGRDEKLTTV